MGVLVYLLLLGQVSIQQFESKLTVQSQKNLLDLAQARERHCSDLLDVTVRQLRYTADRLSMSEAAGGLIWPGTHFWDTDVLSVDRSDTEGAVVQHLYGEGTNEVSLTLSPGASFRRGDSESGVVIMMDEFRSPPCIVMLLPLHEGEANGGMLILQMSAIDLLTRLDRGEAVQGVSTCLVNSEGRILAGSPAAIAKSPVWEISTEDVRGRSLLEDIRLSRGGIGTFGGRAQNGAVPYGYLAGHWPLAGFEDAWSIAAIQDDRAIKTAVVEHARNIQLGMVCLFLTVFLIWVLYYHSARRRILYEQQTVLGQATEELYHVSEQSRHARRELEQQIRLYRSLLNSVPMGLYWKNSEGRLTGYNSEYAHIAGIRRMEEGLSSAQIDMLEQQPSGLPLDMEVMNKDIELLFLPQRYSHKNYLLSKIAVKDEQGRTCGLLGSLLNQDLLNSGREHSFCESLKTDCAWAFLPMPALIIDSRGRVLRCNDSFLRRFEVGAESAAERPLGEVFSPEASDAVESVLRIAAERQSAEATGFYVRRGEDCLWATAQPILQNGSVNGVLLLLTDVSTLKRTEGYLEGLLFRHRRIVRSLYGQMDKLGTKVRKLSRNPSQISAATINEIQYKIGACLEKAAYCEALSSEPTDFLETHDGMVSAERLVEAVRRYLSQQFVEKAPLLDTAVGAGCPTEFEGNWHTLYQALTILVEQAAVCTGGGRIVLRIDSADEPGQGRRMTFSVEHPGLSGLGDEPEKIIDPDASFAQWYPHCAYRDRAMNMRVAARLLSRIGRRLRIERISGHTRYCFDYLPKVISETDALQSSARHTHEHTPDIHREVSDMQESNESAERKQDLQSVRVLVVDDVEENRTLLEVILSKLGYAVVLCGGGKEAIELCRREHCDLILMDIQMPEVDGLEAIRQIRADSLNTGVPIIAMTASGRKDDELAALESGCDDYLNKPINRKLLEQKIWKSLAKMRQIQEAEQGLEITSFLEGDPDYHKTIETFVGNLPNRIEEMRQAACKHDLKDLAFKAHALKGLGGFAGFAVFTEKAARLEESIREQDVDKIQSQIDEMMQMCLRTKIRTDTNSS